jgi:hypothetical protein
MAESPYGTSRSLNESLAGARTGRSAALRVSSAARRATGQPSVRVDGSVTRSHRQQVIGSNHRFESSGGVSLSVSRSHQSNGLSIRVINQS